MIKKVSRTLLAAVAMSAVLTGTASAAVRAVDDDARGTARDCNAQEPASVSIQAAVTASAAGDTIVVCPGTYTEQVTIPADKDRLTLVSRERRQAVIKAPATSTPTYTRLRPDLVRVEGATDVSLASFTISGPLADDHFCNELLNSNVRIMSGGSANLVDNRITKAGSTNPALRGCQNGFGVQIGRNAEGDSGSGRLFYNEIDDYQKGGVYVDGPGSELVAYGNTVRGPDLGGLPASVALAAANGVQVSRGADARLERNRVLDNAFPGFLGVEAGQSTGVILFDNGTGKVHLKENLVQDNDTNIALYNQDDAVIEDNTVLDAVVYDGLYADAESERNRFLDNTAFRNEEHDCHDDSSGRGTAGTANLWRGNRGQTQNRPGLCRK
jgi:hypothetical protein